MSAAPAVAVPRLSLGAALAEELEELADALRRVTVRIHTGEGRFDAVGAGVLWSSTPRPLVLTNAHVVPRRRGNSPRVESVRGQMSSSRVIARDPEIDLALLELLDGPDEFGVAARVGSACQLRVGEMVVAVGHPLGVDGALSVGVVHAVPNDADSWLRTDIRLAPGNSGGPLATLDGDVVGINCMIVRGLGIAVPTVVAERFVHHALSSGAADLTP